MSGLHPLGGARDRRARGSGGSGEGRPQLHWGHLPPNILEGPDVPDTRQHRCEGLGTALRTRQSRWGGRSARLPWE